MIAACEARRIDRIRWAFLFALDAGLATMLGVAWFGMGSLALIFALEWFVLPALPPTRYTYGFHHVLVPLGMAFLGMFAGPILVVARYPEAWPSLFIPFVVGIMAFLRLLDVQGWAWMNDGFDSSHMVVLLPGMLGACALVLAPVLSWIAFVFLPWKRSHGQGEVGRRAGNPSCPR